MSNNMAIKYEWLRCYRVSKFRTLNLPIMLKFSPSKFITVYRSPNGFSITEPRHFFGDKHAPVPLDSPQRLVYVREDDVLRRIPLMSEPALNGCHGYIVHDSCWRLMLKASEPSGFSVAKLVLMCESHPISKTYCCVLWGHTYEGHIVPDVRHCQSWESCSVRLAMWREPLRDPFKIRILEHDLSDLGTYSEACHKVVVCQGSNSYTDSSRILSSTS